jgi:hypothetical protein
MRARTGHVWHPMGRPSGLARSLGLITERAAPRIVLDAALRMNSLLDSVGMVSSWQKHGPSFFSWLPLFGELQTNLL